jgi:hypothetical protein
MGQVQEHPLQLAVWMHSRQAVAASSEEEMLAVFLEDGQGSATREARVICRPGEPPSGFYRDIVNHARRQPLRLHRWGLIGQPLCKTCGTTERAT